MGGSFTIEAGGVTDVCDKIQGVPTVWPESEFWDRLVTNNHLTHEERDTLKLWDKAKIESSVKPPHPIFHCDVISPDGKIYSGYISYDDTARDKGVKRIIIPINEDESVMELLQIGTDQGVFGRVFYDRPNHMTIIRKIIFIEGEIGQEKEKSCIEIRREGVKPRGWEKLSATRFAFGVARSIERSFPPGFSIVPDIFETS